MLNVRLCVGVFMEGFGEIWIELVIEGNIFELELF